MKNRTWNEAFVRRTLIILISLAVVAATALAQPPSATTPKPPPRPEEALLAKMREARKDPAQTVELLIQLINEFPESSAAESAGFTFANTLKLQARLDNDPAKLQTLAHRFVTGTAAAPPLLRVRLNSRAVAAMLDHQLTESALELAQQTVPFLDENQFVAHERKKHEAWMESARKRDANAKPRPFDEARAHLDFRLSTVSYHTSLGRGYLKLNQLAVAEEAYRKAYQTDPTFAAAATVGLATILEQRGQDNEALDYLTRAALNGRMDKAGLAQFHALYRKTHGGKLDGVEEYLDTRFRATHRNPVKGEKYQAAPGRSERVMLAEFFTGAGCLPCIPFDYSFERALEDYARRDLALLVYHWHAPTLDPMGNRASDARVKYYGVTGAPTVFLDGRKFGKGEDNLGEDRDPNTAQRAYAALTAQIRAGLTTPAHARLKLTATQQGASVEVRVTADRLNETDAILHLALVENEVTYSGENGLRFHPMVVRSLAKAAGASDYGFPVAPSQTNKFTHLFQLESISAENLRYYDEWPAERNKEVNARIGGDADFDVGKFKEQRHQINPNHLSVVAFLQDNQTKAIRQAVYFRLAAKKQ